MTLPRRRVLAIGAGVGATLLAGCTGGTGPTTDSEPETGEFRLLISDQPADIGDFDSLDVTFSDARIFPAGTAGTEAPILTTTGNETMTTEQNETATTEAETTDDGESAEADGHHVLDLEGKTVDLTQVIGEDATPVFEGELAAGEYTKIELNVADIAGVVDGEDVEVKVPSEKLKITNNFEVGPDEPVDFVFDINVVKRGPMNGYILKPVISESGVAGRDVEVREVSMNGTTSGA